MSLEIKLQKEARNTNAVLTGITAVATIGLVSYALKTDAHWAWYAGAGVTAAVTANKVLTT